MLEPLPCPTVEIRPPSWLRRHHLLWIAPAHHAAVGAEVPDAALRGAVASGLAAGWPVVVCQQSNGRGQRDSQARVAVGMPLPLAQGKRRVAILIAPEWIADTAAPPFLRDVIPCLPESRRAALVRLVQRADAIDLALRVYGSVAWEALTGRAYLTPASDIDLLLQPSTRGQLAAAIAMLATWEAETGVRADGEILFGDDDAVAWREWMCGGRQWKSPSTRVLVKAASGPRLATRGKLLASLPGPEVAAVAAA